MKNSFIHKINLLAILMLSGVMANAGVINQASDQKKPEIKKHEPIYLMKDIYTADPSAHVFNGKIYVYPSHDIESGIKENDNGDHFDMRDFHINTISPIPPATPTTFVMPLAIILMDPLPTRA